MQINHLHPESRTTGEGKMSDDLPDFKSGPDFIMVTKEHFAELQKAIADRDNWKQIAVEMQEQEDAAREAAGKDDHSDTYGLESLADIITRIMQERDKAIDEARICKETAINETTFLQLKLTAYMEVLATLPKTEFERLHELALTKIPIRALKEKGT